MDLNKAIRLMIIEHSIQDAEAINSQLRSIGLPIRPCYFSREDDVLELIKQHNPETILLRHDHPNVDITDVVSYTRTLPHEVPIILLQKSGEMSPEEAIESGANDLAHDDRYSHLKHIIYRSAHISRLSQELNTLEKLYQASEEHCQSLLGSSRDAIAYIHAGMHVYANQTYLDMFGFLNFEDIEGLPIMDLVVADKQEPFKHFLRTMTTGENKVHFQTELILADKTKMEADLEFSPASIEGEPCEQIIIRRQEVNTGNTKELEEQLSRMARIDTHTGLLNRKNFITDFHTTLETMSQQNKEYAYLHISLDKFDVFKEDLGILGSDNLVVAVATHLKQMLGDNAHLCVYSGATFSYLFPVTQRSEEIETHCKKILSSISTLRPTIAGKTISNLSFSIGAYLIDDSSIQVDEVLSRSEKACIKASTEGGNSFSLYQPEEGEMTRNQINKSWVEKLETALKSDRFRLRYQPIVKLEGGKTERYEVSIQMQDATGKNVPTREFLSAANETGFAKKIDRWIIDTAFNALSIKIKQTPGTVLLIKLTASSLKDQYLFSWIKEKLKNAELPRNCLIFSVSETSIRNHIRQAKAFSSGLQAIGCGFAVDNFSFQDKGFSGLEDIPVQFVKFDPTLSSDLPNSKANQKIISNLSKQAHNLQKQTIVQDVADPMTLSIIWTIGCDYIQGDFISPPLKKMNFDFSSTIA